MSSGLSVEPKPRARVETPAAFTTSLTNSSLNLATIRAEPAPTSWNDRGTLDTTEIFRRAEGLLGAFGQAMTIAQDRRASETLDVLLTAQHENLALVLQGMAQQRQEYGEALERTIERFARDLAPESILTIGETFRMSAGEITGALRRGEHMQGRVLEVLTGIREHLAQLVRNGAALATPPTAVKVDEPRPDKPPLALVPHTKKAAPESPLLHLDDDE